MIKAKQISGVPAQIKGSFHDTESEMKCDSLTIFRKFAVLKERFFSINQWKEYCGDGSTDFKLHDSVGNLIESIPKTGNFIRIDIPGPGLAETKGFDWVEITDIFHENTETFERVLITCRPCKNPTNKESNHIAHFYSDKASSTFMISRNNKDIRAAIYGRNEVPNLNAAFIDKIRNLIIAVGGMAKISKIQWKCLTDGLLDFE